MDVDRPVGQAQQHRHNLALVMRLAARSAPVSRARLAADSGLTKSTVTQLVGELLEAGLLRDIGIARASGAGRPSNLLVPDSLGPLGLGVQIEMDHVAGCLMDLTGRVRGRMVHRCDNRGSGPDEAARAAQPVLRRLLDDASSTGNPVAGVMAGLPATVRGQQVIRSSVFDWTDVAMTVLVRDRLAAMGAGGIPVDLGNDLNLVAAAEARARGSAEAANLLYVGGELGVGAGIVLNGAVHRGANGEAGELGHVPIEPGGDRCACGAAGCLDTVAGQEAMLRAAGLEPMVRTRLVGGTGPLPALVRSGEKRAVAAARRAGRGLGAALGSLVAALDPAAVVLGGRFADFGPDFLDMVAESLPGSGRVGLLSISKLPPDAVARAAAGAVVRGLVEDPWRWLAQ
ncbi:ROK family protein [Amycolatopsis nigrescens]|uniref:ROK family protein n=1 Tax=Amycolatopsis nigrescens TaxID=381445 RepID=UPI000477209C|nr:ROK family protein [Amycolatopsis nigrescens]